MTFFALGLNHETASVDLTEAYALDDHTQEKLYQAVSLSGSAELVLLSTCNRTEAYLYGTENDVEQVKAMLSHVAGQVWPHDDSFLYRDEDAVTHVLEVTSGLRSLVVGDAQILAQMKEAYRRAVDAGTVDSLLHRLMHTSFRAAKRVTTETGLSSGAMSVSSASVAMARDHFADIAGQDLVSAHVLLVGAGKMGRLALNAMKDHEPNGIRVTNRSAERAERVAEAHDAGVVDWADRYEAMRAADVVIVATGAPDPVIKASHVPDRRAQATPALLIDIALPRNVDPSVDTLDGYTVYDLDALQDWTDRVEAERSDAIPKAKGICDELMRDYVTWVFHQQALQPAIQAVRETFDSIRTREIERHHTNFEGADREEIEQLTQSIMQKLLAVPIVRLKNVDPDSIDFVRGIELLRLLFSRSENTDSSRLAPADTDVQPSLDDIPSACPFDEQAAPTESRRPSEEELLKQVLRDSSHRTSDS